jgi:hypothetical protein
MKFQTKLKYESNLKHSSKPVRCCSLICLVSAITQKKDKLQAENILDILQIKQVINLTN